MLGSESATLSRTSATSSAPGARRSSAPSAAARRAASPSSSEPSTAAMLVRRGGVRVDRLAEAGAPQIFRPRELIGREGRAEDRQAGRQRLRDGVVAAVADDDVADLRGRPPEEGALPRPSWTARGRGSAGSVAPAAMTASQPRIRIASAIRCRTSVRAERKLPRETYARGRAPARAGETLDERLGGLRPDAGAQEPACGSRRECAPSCHG